MMERDVPEIEDKPFVEAISGPREQILTVYP